MIPVGTYPVRPITATLAETKKGDPQIAVEVEHTSAEHSGTRARWYGGMGSDSAVELTVKTLRECGLSDAAIASITEAGAATFPAHATGSAVYMDDTDLDGRPIVRLRYLNGGERALRAPSDTARDTARARLAKALGTATSAPVVPEKLRPFLAAVASVTDAAGGARLWRQFGAQRQSWSPEEQKIAWNTLITRAPGEQMKALLAQPVAAPVIVPPPATAQQDDKPPF